MEPSARDQSNSPPRRPRRADLHCHSEASCLTAEAVLNAIHCPECYSTPQDVYAQAKRRAMDFVTITDHDTMEGIKTLAGRADVLVGEELTCFFPEDACKLHVLVFGLGGEDHERLQGMARDIYRVAEYLERHNLAHAVAHPIYRQNDKLERWHVERLLLLFKGLECLNGAHSPLHREAFEPLLEWLSRERIEKLSAKHDLAPRWPVPWVKARTGGSDDHGLLNVGRTWTEFPPDADTPAKVLQCLRDGTCRPGGESGSSAKLAHTFYSVAVRYYSRHIMPGGTKPNFTTSLLQAIVGERPAPGKMDLLRAAIKGKLKRLTAAVARPLRRGRSEQIPGGTSLLKKLFLTSFKDRLGDQTALREALSSGLPPLGEHEDMLRLVNDVNRDVTRGLKGAIDKAFATASFTGLFEAIAALLAQQFVLSPYYFSLFHQNKERHLLRKLTGRLAAPDERTLKVGLFTDTLDDVNGVCRFLCDMAGQSSREGRRLVIHTCASSPRHELPNRRNFVPLLGLPLPAYPEMNLSIPPVLEVLAWADREQFDVIHVSTPGPMGLMGMLAARMLRAPVLGTYHTDFPAYAEKLTGDHRVANGTRAYCEWFYRRLSSVFSRSRAYELNLRDLGVSPQKTATLAPCVDTQRFNPRRRDEAVWRRIGVTQPHRLLYCGRVSVEKNLEFLARAYEQLASTRRDTALVIVGDGPHLAKMRQRLAGLPAYFPGARDDDTVAALYASSDLLVFPSRTDTLGQVVLEAQASGLPALVSSVGGPREIVEHETSGLVLPTEDPGTWATVIATLLDDPARRQSMSRAAARRAGRFSLARTFEQFWQAHVGAIQSGDVEVDTHEEAEPVAHPNTDGWHG
jgi:glycosyltransferase involved in cell wall biosynthesis